MRRVENYRTAPVDARATENPNLVRDMTRETGTQQLRAVENREQVEDRDLLARVQRGDQAAFAALVGRHLPRVVALAKRMLRDDAEAEDVAQETLLRLWKSGEAIDVGPAGLRPWLRRVASNLCIDRARTGGRFVVTDEVPDAGVEADQLKGLEDRELSQRVGAALKGLPDRQRQALTLFHYEGLSQIEIASLMGISDEAVESLLARARRALKSGLAQEWKNLASSGS